MNWNIAYFIAKRLRNDTQTAFSVIISRIAVGSIAVGLAAILVSSMIFEGFRSEIQEKIFALAGHIQVKKFDLRNSYDESPISTQSYLYQEALNLPNVSHIQRYSQKAGLLKTDEEVLGVVLKGVDFDFDSTRFKAHLIAGKLPDFGKSESKLNVLISQKIADKLQLTIEDETLIYFVQQPPRARKVTISGIYNTGLEEFDEQVAIGSNQLIQQLNAWPDTLVGGFEIFLDDFEQLNRSYEKIYDAMDYDLQIEKVTDKYIHLFDWFLMVNQNAIIFIIILLFVACFNVASIVLILIMERIQMIGTFKALGAQNRLVQQVFFLNGVRMLLKGLVLGNILAFTFGILQKQFKFIPLDPENYYISAVPIQFDLLFTLEMNILITVLVALVLFIPTIFISSISPIQAIRFD